jgi:hypothetical protein
MNNINGDNSDGIDDEINESDDGGNAVTMIAMNNDGKAATRERCQQWQQTTMATSDNNSNERRL